MSAVLWMYLSYGLASAAMTVWVAQTLHKNGRIFLEDAFNGNRELAESVNHLLVVGFYLVNLGFILLFLRTQAEVGAAREAVELFSVKLGTVLLVLGFMHFFNMLVLAKVRRRNRNQQLPPLPETPVGGQQ